MQNNTPQRVVISLGNGSLSKGFASVRVQRVDVLGQSQRYWQATASLPPIPELLEKYTAWSMMHEGWHTRSPDEPANRGISIASSGITNFSKTTFAELCTQIKSHIDRWFDHESFREPTAKLFSSLNHESEIHLILETDEAMLWRIPWHQWKFFDLYAKAELILSPLECSSQVEVVKPSSSDVKMLAILGDSAGIDLEPDKEAIESIAGLKTEFLLQPDLKTLTDGLREESYDILFFAGHSTSRESDNTAKIYLSPTLGLSLSELNHGMRKAIENGLQLAIFNSCDGVGLAQSLASILPHIIVMREDVPDRVAQIFLQHLLKEFSEGRSLPLAVREARQALQGLEDKFPCASWLPLVCEHSQTKPMYWSDWQAPEPLSPIEAITTDPPLRSITRSSTAFPIKSERREVVEPQSWRKRILHCLGVSAAVTAIVMGVRYTGVLQSFELAAFDAMMRMRPAEPMDDRFLVIEVTEEDLAYQTEKGMTRQGSLSDQALSKVLEKLEPHQPAAIGIDIYHDFPINPKATQLDKQFQRIDNLFMICKHSDSQINFSGISSAKSFPDERASFSDTISDSDGVLRRHLLHMSPASSSPCKTESSLSEQLAGFYLSNYSNFNIENLRLPLLSSRWGGYQGIDDRGYQIMLNYRASSTSNQLNSISRGISLKQVLENEFNPTWVRDKIILIGVTARSVKDLMFTPLSQKKESGQEINGVYAQANMTSQLISAAIDGRKLISAWSFWQESLLILAVTVSFGLLLWHSSLSWKAIWILSSTSALVCLSYTLAFIYVGIWLPMIPTMVSIFGLVGLQLLKPLHNHIKSSEFT